MTFIYTKKLRYVHCLIPGSGSGSDTRLPVPTKNVRIRIGNTDLYRAFPPFQFLLCAIFSSYLCLWTKWALVALRFVSNMAHDDSAGDPLGAKYLLRGRTAN
jgi:hypothetical protein